MSYLLFFFSGINIAVSLKEEKIPNLLVGILCTFVGLLLIREGIS